LEEVTLWGGVANAGSVTRVGPHVLRPANRFTPQIHRFLAGLHRTGFDGAPVPVGIEADGRERITYQPGEVALPLYPRWVQTDDALASIAVLMGRFHAASALVPWEASEWSAEILDPAVGPASGGSVVAERSPGIVVCHNDVCLENVVFRDGRAAGLVDFDFAAPGRPVYDLGQCARMCIPVDDDRSAAQLGFEPADRAARLRLMADAYGLDGAGRAVLMAVVDRAVADGGLFVQRHVEAGEPGFIAMWEFVGGMARFDRRRDWWAIERPRFARAMR
jgi:hypothetical protein